MKIEAPLALHHATVESAWVDYNGHMNEAYYVLVFSHATDDFMDFAGLGEVWREAANASVYTLETHIVYLMEVAAGAALRVDTQLLGFDEKRFHLFHAMHHAATGALLATGEHMLLHVDMDGPKASPLPPEIVERLKEIAEAHAGLPAPNQAGRSIALPGAVARHS